MTKSRLMSFILTAAVTFAGGSVFATASCGDQLRTSIQGAAMDFVKGSTSTILQTLFPVKDMLTPPQ